MGQWGWGDGGGEIGVGKLGWGDGGGPMGAGLGIRSFDFQMNRSFFVQKLTNERFAKKMSDSFIRSFLVSDLSDSLTIAHFLSAT